MESHNTTQGTMSAGHGGHGGAAMPSMLLVPLDKVTHTVVQSGDWSDPATWGGAVPGEGARVHVPSGLSVTVDAVLAPEIKTVRVDGTLRFATDRATELKVDTLVTAQAGTLEIGTAATPIDAGVTATITFADDGAIDQNWDPSLVSRGAILHGTTTVYGAQKTAFTTLETQPRAGATEITLDTLPTGWRVGDTIAIAGTDPKDPTTDETRVIREIDGTTIRFEQPLVRDHVAPRPDLDVHVANLTRNVVFTSENTAIDHRGHVMVMHTNDADINFAAFDDLGRSDKTVPYDDWVLPVLDPVEPTLLGGENVRGRYSFHVHRGGTDKDGTPAKVNGSVVTDGPGWGFVNHSSNVDFTNNVTHNVVGAAYYTEAGDEIGSFIGNIAMRTVNPDFPLETGETVETSITDNGIPRRDSFLGEEGVGDPTDPGGRELRQDYGFQGDGFWFHGPNVQVENNVVTGASGHAYIWWAEGLIERFPDGTVRQMTHDAENVPGGDLIGPDGTQVQIYDTPIGSFDGNQGYSATNGLRFFYFQTDFFGPGVYEEAGVTPPPPAYDAQLRSTIANTTIWNVERTGLDASYANNITLRDSTFIGTGDPSTVGIDLDHPFTERGWQISNVTVEDFGTGIQAPRQGGLLIDGATLANLTDVEIRETQGGARDLTFRDVALAPLDNALAGQEAGRTNYDLTVTTGVEAEVRRTEWDPLWFLQPDRIVVESTGGARQALFFPEQRPDFVPVPATDPLAAVLPTEIVGLTNRQLMDQYGLSFAGGLLPSGATPGAETQTGRFTDGLVGSPLPAPTLYPPFSEFNPDDQTTPIVFVDETRSFAVETGFQARPPVATDPVTPSVSGSVPDDTGGAPPGPIDPTPPAPTPEPDPDEPDETPADPGTGIGTGTGTGTGDGPDTGEGTPTIGFVGDSITAGDADRSFVPALGQTYDGAAQFLNVGIGSAGVTRFAGNRIQDSPEYQQLLASDASTVWVMIGGNDIIGGADVESYVASLSEVVAELQAMPSSPQVVIAAQPPFFAAYPSQHATFLAEWVPAMRQLAETTGAQFANINSAVTDYPDNYPDDVHPNAAGAATLAGLIGRELEAIGALDPDAPAPPPDMPDEPVDTPDAPDVPDLPGNGVDGPGDPEMPDTPDGAPADPDLPSPRDVIRAHREALREEREERRRHKEEQDENREDPREEAIADDVGDMAPEGDADRDDPGSTMHEPFWARWRLDSWCEPEEQRREEEEEEEEESPGVSPLDPAPSEDAMMLEGDTFLFPRTGYTVIDDFDPVLDRFDITGRGDPGGVEILDEPDGTTLLLNGGDLFLPGVEADAITEDSFLF